jgi:hypothetical protein
MSSSQLIIVINNALTGCYEIGYYTTQQLNTATSWLAYFAVILMLANMVTALPATLWKTHGRSTSTIIWIVGGIAIGVSIIPALIYLAGYTEYNEDKDSVITEKSRQDSTLAFDAIVFLITLLIGAELLGWVFTRRGKTPALGGLFVFLPLLVLALVGVSMSQLIFDSLAINNPGSVTEGGVIAFIVFNNLFYILVAVFGIVIAEHPYTRSLANGEISPDAEDATGYPPTAGAYPISHPHQPGWAPQPNQPIYENQPQYAAAPPGQPGFAPAGSNVHTPWPQQPQQPMIQSQTTTPSPVQPQHAQGELNKTQEHEPSLYV